VKSVVYNGFWASPAQSLGSESHGTHYHILFFQIRDSLQPGGSGLRIYISQDSGGPGILTGNEFHFRRLVRLVGLGLTFSNPPTHGHSLIAQLAPLESGSESESESESELLYDWRFTAN
jgi:hypothetical protein